MRVRRALFAGAAVGVALSVAGCTSPTPDTSPSVTVLADELPAPAAELSPIAAPTDADAGDEPVPTVSVQVTTSPPAPPAPDDGGGDGSSGDTGGGASGSVAQSVTQASADYASQLVALANGARADAGLGALRGSACARNAAVARAGRALAKAHLEHEPLPDCGSGWTGENLARHHGTPAAMHAAWMGSAGHRKNILLPQFTGIGVGCAAYSRSNPQQVATRASDIGGYVCSQVFVG